MVTVILSVLALWVVHTILPGWVRIAKTENPLGLGLGPRDEYPPHTTLSARAARAQNNLLEALVLFLPIALLLMATDRVTAGAIQGAWVFFAARVAYLVLYVFGVPVVRSLAWGGGWAGIVMMLMALLKNGL